MRYRLAAMAAAAACAATLTVRAQAPQPTPAPWRGAGVQPCVGSDGGTVQCPPRARDVAVRAGHLFDSKSGQMLAKQVVLLHGARITAVGAEGQIKIPDGAEVVDLGQAWVLPGMIDAHTHMFNNRGPKMSAETAMLIAVQNAQADLMAGFTGARDMTSHGNGYADVTVRDAINEGRFEGPRYQVSTRGIVWGTSQTPEASPLASAVVRNEEEARAAVRDQIAHGADWIKLFPGGAYSFSPAGEANYVTTYPLPVLKALVDETHRGGKKTACHVLGGEGLQNSIEAGCDSVEHAYSLTQQQAEMMVAKKLFYDPTLQRYIEPYMDDNDMKSTGGKFRMIPIFEKAVTTAVGTKGLKIMIGSGVDGSTFVHGTQALELQMLVQRAGLTPARAIQSATIINAEAMGWQTQMGAIEKDMYADLVALSADPLKDITEVQRVKFVMKGGKIVKNELRAR